jgi:hypothetical protein
MDVGMASGGDVLASGSRMASGDGFGGMASGCAGAETEVVIV